MRLNSTQTSRIKRNMNSHYNYIVFIRRKAGKGNVTCLDKPRVATVCLQR